MTFVRPVRQVLQQCLPSVSTLEAMLNSYASVPPCYWLDALSPEVYQVVSVCNQPSWLHAPLLHFSSHPLLLPQEHRLFWDLLRQRSGLPRSLQHLCRHSVRRHLGSRCHSVLGALDIPSAVREYLLLCADDSLH